jgi:hypothetical protein
VSWREYAWRYLRGTMEDEITLHCEQTLVWRAVSRGLHALEKIAKCLGRYRVVCHHNPIMRMRALSENPLPYGTCPRNNRNTETSTSHLSG